MRFSYVAYNLWIKPTNGGNTLLMFQVTQDTTLGELSRLLDSDHFVIVVLKQLVCKFYPITFYLYSASSMVMT